jgi:chorismate-pyruvate lyase
MPAKKITEASGTDLHELLKDSQIEPSSLRPFQKILLIADGTLTNILEAFLNEPIGVVKLSEEIVSITADILPLEIKVGTFVLERQILLQGKTSQRNWLYADSIIVLERVEERFREKLIKSHTPIGKLWVEHKTETFKELIRLLTIGLRVLTLLEFVGQSNLSGEPDAGLLASDHNRETSLLLRNRY